MVDDTSSTWDPNDLSSRPIGCWQYYRNGVIVPISEGEARNNFDRWRCHSDDRGAATFMLEQLWNEIDQLRARISGTPVVSSDDACCLCFGFLIIANFCYLRGWCKKWVDLSDEERDQFIGVIETIEGQS